MIVSRVYPTINLHTQASGRHSTTNPPLTTLPDDLRDLILPEVGHVEFGYDWRQIELLIIAAEAGDKPMLDAFDQGHDLHTINTCDTFTLPYPPDLVSPHRVCHADDPLYDWQQMVYWKGSKDLRRKFNKPFIFRLCYGARPDTCGDIPGAVTLGFTGRALIRAAENWLNRHPAIRAFQRKCVEFAAKTGTIYSFMGRRRTLADTGDEAARQAMNHPMQGGCMDVYEIVLYEVDKAFYPTLKFRWGAHDAHKWDLSLEAFEADRAAGWPLLKAVRDIVQQTFIVNNRPTQFKADFHIMYDNGRVEPWAA